MNLKSRIGKLYEKLEQEAGKNKPWKFYIVHKNVGADKACVTINNVRHEGTIKEIEEKVNALGGMVVNIVRAEFDKKDPGDWAV